MTAASPAAHLPEAPLWVPLSPFWLARSHGVARAVGGGRSVLRVVTVDLLVFPGGNCLLEARNEATKSSGSLACQTITPWVFLPVTLKSSE